MVIAVVGSRRFRRDDLVDRWLAVNFGLDDHLLTGGAAGVDTWAIDFAKRHGYHYSIIRPDYDKWPVLKHGKDFAPKERNKQIANGCDLMVAFWDGRSGGTANAIAWAARLRKRITVEMADD